MALTIDIEDWYHLPPITGAPRSRFRDVQSFFAGWSSHYDYLTEPTLRVLRFLGSLNLKATFFVVADVLEKYPGLVERVAQEGHEIACHGLHHACKIDPRTKQPLMTKTEFKDRTTRAKHIIEQAIGQEVIGYRAPNAYIAGWMVDVLEDIGFKYDSSVSVNSFYNKSDSHLRNVTTSPYYPSQGSLDRGDEGRGIVEIPWPYFQFIFKFPSAGGPILRLLGASFVRHGLEESVLRGDTIFYFHPLDLAEGDFPLSSSMAQRLFWLVKGRIVEERVRKILGRMGALTDMCTCAELLRSRGNLNADEISREEGPTNVGPVRTRQPIGQFLSTNRMEGCGREDVRT